MTYDQHTNKNTTKTRPLQSTLQKTKVIVTLKFQSLHAQCLPIKYMKIQKTGLMNCVYDTYCASHGRTVYL